LFILPLRRQAAFATGKVPGPGILRPTVPWEMAFLCMKKGMFEKKIGKDAPL
jgi:hypothetical protein